MRSVHVVFRAHAEAPHARIEPRLLQQRRPVSGRVDDHSRAQQLAPRPHAHHPIVLEYWTFHLSRDAHRGPRIHRPPREKLEHAAHIDHAHPRPRVIVNRRIAGRQKAHPRYRMIQGRRNRQRFQFIDKTAAAGANGRTDLVVLLQDQRRASAPRQGFRRRQPRRTAARNNSVVAHCVALYCGVSQVALRLHVMLFL